VPALNASIRFSPQWVGATDGIDGYEMAK
jgi:hypothetical protein